MEARCPCGSVTLAIEGEPLFQLYCHCDDCQHAHSAAYVPRAIVLNDQVSVVAGETRSWFHNVRTMNICRSCGSHLYSERKGSNYRGVNAALFPEGTFAPGAHIHCKFAVAPIRDGLPHYLDLPAEFGGSGELADW